MANLNLAEFIRERDIRNYIDFLAIAEEQRTAGQMAIAEFEFKQNEKILLELVTKIWEMKSTKENLAASKVSRSNTDKKHI